MGVMKKMVGCGFSDSCSSLVDSLVRIRWKFLMKGVSKQSVKSETSKLIIRLHNTMKARALEVCTRGMRAYFVYVHALARQSLDAPSTEQYSGISRAHVAEAPA